MADGDDRTADDPADLGRRLEPFRNYLRLLAKVEIGRQLRGKVDESDVVQEVFLAAHRYYPTFRGTADGQFARWLREILAGVLANQVRHYLGTRARDVRLEVGLAADLDRSASALAGVPVDPHSSPSQQAARGEQAILVAEALARLSDDYQTVIVLRHMEGLTFPEIAARLGRSVDSVEKLWIRGVTQLRKAFGGAS